MNIQSLCPYGLKSLIECASRATLLSQPADIPDFLLQYVSEQISFRKSQPEDDPKVVSFNYQEILENNLLRKTETPIATIETSVPSQTKVHPKPSPPPRVGNNLVVRGKGNSSPTPSTVSVKTHIVSKLRVAGQQQSKGKEDDVKKTPGTRRLLPTPIPQKPTPADKASTSRVTSQPAETPAIPVQVVKRRLVPPPIPKEKADNASKSRAISQPSKKPAIPVQVVKRRLVPPPIPEKKADNASKSRAISQPSKTPAIPVQVVKRRLVPPPIPEEKADNASKSRAISQPSKTPAIPVQVVKRRLVPPPIPEEKTRGVRISETKILSKTETKTDDIKTVKPKQKRSGRPRPESTKESKEAGTESNKPKAKVQEKSSQPNQSADISRGDRVLWIDRERVKPILNLVKERGEGKCFHNLHDLATPIVIIKYRRIRIRASPNSQCSPSLNSYGL